MARDGVRLSSLIAPSFYGLHRDVKQHKHTHYWLKGGRGSTKSSFISIELILGIMKHKGLDAVVYRKVGNTMRRSVFEQLKWAIRALGVQDSWTATISPMALTYVTGQQILFSGLDEADKGKSIKSANDYFGYVWFEELAEFAGMGEIRTTLQSVLRGGDKYWVFYSYNPPKSQDAWVNQETLTDNPDRIIHTSSYLQVPKEWLGEQFLLEAERMKETNPTAYAHEYMGEVTGTGGAVFENVAELPMTDAAVSQFDHRFFGLDFGFSVDPLAFVAMHYDAKHEDLYIFDELYQQKLTNGRAASMIRKMYPTARIIADSAEPKSIAEMRDYGVNVSGVRKGPDSVDFGIRWLQNRGHIYIDKARCPNTYKEFVCYEYDRNRDGQFVNAYPDKNNHAIDAVRYGMQPAMPRGHMRVLRWENGT